MIIQNRSRCNYFLVRKCARRVFTEQSRRWKILVATAVMGAVTAVILLGFLPFSRLKIGKFKEIREVNTELFLNPNPIVTNPIPETKTLNLDDRIIAGDFGTANHIEPDAVPATPDRVEETIMTAKIEENLPIVALADTEVQDTRAELAPEPMYAPILGQITLKRKETLSKIIRQVYGGFNASYLKSFIIANPSIENPDRVAVGQIISLPAIPVAVAPGDNRVWWIKVDETDTLDGAFKILRNHSDGFPPVRLIPYWNPADGSKFAVVLGKLFKDEKSAHTRQGQLPAELSSGSSILSQWDKKTVFFANPYFGPAP